MNQCETLAAFKAAGIPEPSLDTIYGEDLYVWAFGISRLELHEDSCAWCKKQVWEIHAANDRGGCMIQRTPVGDCTKLRELMDYVKRWKDAMTKRELLVAFKAAGIREPDCSATGRRVISFVWTTKHKTIGFNVSTCEACGKPLWGIMAADRPYMRDVHIQTIPAGDLTRLREWIEAGDEED